MGLFAFIRGMFASRRNDALTEDELHSAHQSAGVDPADAVCEATDNPPLPAEAGNEDAEAPVEPHYAGWWTPRSDAVRETPKALPPGGVQRELFDKLTRVIDDPDFQLPRIPLVAQRALLMLRNEDVSFHKLAELVGKDPGLSAEVLRVSNSAAYRGLTEIRSLEQAFARVGFRTTKSVILAATLRSVTAIRTGGEHRSIGEELWRRSLGAGALCALAAKRVDVQPDDAFMAGLLHDLGMLAILRVIHDHQAATGEVTPRPVFDALCEEWHQHLGLRLATAWNLPDPLPEVVGNHHQPIRDDDPFAPFRTLVAFADVCCAMLEYAPYVPYDFFNLDCVQRLGFVGDAASQEFLAGIPAYLEQRLVLDN